MAILYSAVLMPPERAAAIVGGAQHEFTRRMDTLKKLDQPGRGLSLALALLPVMILLLLPVRWNSNEEGYIQYAYQAVAPGEFSEHSAIFDRSRARFLFQWTVGSLVATVGYENAWVISRLVMAALYAWGLGLLFAGLGVSIAEAVGILGVFLLAGQQLFGGEWLFLGVEAKTVAYAFVAAGFGLYLTGRPRRSIGCMAVATYAHFLVGGFWTLALGLLVRLREGVARPALVALAVVGIVAAPLAAVIVLDQAAPTPPAVAGGPDANEIYALRAPHHVAPFADVWELWRWSGGIVLAFALLAAFAVWAHRESADVWPRYLVALLAYLFAALGLSFLDRHAHLFAKFYLFRPSSFILLLAITIGVRHFRRRLPQPALALSAVFLLAIAAPAYWSVAQTKVEEAVRGYPTRAHAALKEALLLASRPGDVILLESSDRLDQDLAMLPRYLERPTLVSYMFPPTNPSGLRRWYELLQFRRGIFTDGCRAALAYPVQLLVVFDPKTLGKVASCGPIIWEHGATALVRVDDIWRTAD